LRAQGVAIGAIVNRVTSGVISMTFLSLCKAITTGGAFFLFAAVAVAAWIFHYTMLPETRGKTLEEIEGSFGHFWRRNPKPKGLHGTNGDIPLTSSVKTSTNID